MKSPCAILALLSFLLAFASTVESRKDPAGEYWRSVMKDQPMPKAIQEIISHGSESVPENSNKKTDCHGTKNSFIDNFEPTPNLSAYPDDAKLAGTFTDNFEPTPNASLYPDDAKLAGTFPENFEPNVGAKNKLFAEDFEPGPHASIYRG